MSLFPVASRACSAVALLVCAFLAGCSGSGYGLDANGNPIAPGSSSTPPPLTADLQSIEDNVFTPICVRCHSGASAPEGLQLDSAHAYADLVGVPSQEQPSVLRVAPGNPSGSYLIQKLEGAPSISGVQMPFGGPYLPQSTIDVIAQWITDGAPNVTTASPAAEGLASTSTGNEATDRAADPETEPVFAVTATSPDSGAIVSAPLGSIVVAFNHEVDATLVNDRLIQLAASPAVTGAEDVAPPDRSAIPISLALARGDPSAVVITPLTALGPGSYQVTVHGGAGGALGLADVDAQVLGTDYSFVFTVEAQ